MSSPSPLGAQQPTSVEPKKQTPGVSVGIMSGGAGVMMSVSLSLIVSIIFSYGAAKLSYDTFHSVGWAVLAFFFSGIYYPYYALFLHKPPPPAPLGMLGARRR